MQVKLRVEINDLYRTTSVTLPAHTIYENGLTIIEEYPDLITRVYQDVGDLDVAGSYRDATLYSNVY